VQLRWEGQIILPSRGILPHSQLEEFVVGNVTFAAVAVAAAGAVVVVVDDVVVAVAVAVAVEVFSLCRQTTLQTYPSNGPVGSRLALVLKIRCNELAPVNRMLADLVPQYILLNSGAALLPYTICRWSERVHRSSLLLRLSLVLIRHDTLRSHPSGTSRQLHL